MWEKSAQSITGPREMNCKDFDYKTRDFLGKKKSIYTGVFSKSVVLMTPLMQSPLYFINNLII